MTYHAARPIMPPSPDDLAASTLRCEIERGPAGYTVRVDCGRITHVSGPHRGLLRALASAWRICRRHGPRE